jgi:hypothetical protein
MGERVMVVSGAFATHTTKLYNYYVCPDNWDISDVGYIVVVYFSQLQYIGKVNRQINWSLNNSNPVFSGLNRNNLHRFIINDLQKFEPILNVGDHYLFELTPILNSSCQEHIQSYQGIGAFTRSHRYFDGLDYFFVAFKETEQEEFSDDFESITATNDGETNII